MRDEIRYKRYGIDYVIDTVKEYLRLRESTWSRWDRGIFNSRFSPFYLRESFKRSPYVYTYIVLTVQEFEKEEVQVEYVPGKSIIVTFLTP
jgi:hypothetical protein